ncbi:hypothetical protein AB0C70_42230 [Streptomyces sp. NPDC048564]|uniref:hypothetical protein n=1 Tax=Streptomyces sp. NPDC048564 TaxID=3155760 RepID=UPI00343D285C
MGDESPEEGAVKFSEDGDSLLVYRDGEWTSHYGPEGDPPPPVFKEGEKKT